MAELRAVVRRPDITGLTKVSTVESSPAAWTNALDLADPARPSDRPCNHPRLAVGA
jgi:hypothetical protein